jgi:signal transduction histidine kinase
VLTAELAALGALQVEHAAGAERERIARDVHDIVAHSLTVVMLHVTGARRMLATDPDRAAEALERAEEVGRESLDQIRGVVGLLRSGDDGANPGLGDVEGLVERFRRSGIHVTTTIDVDQLGDVDPTTGLVAYRVVQEALSNAVRHAGGAPIEVMVASAPEGGSLVVEVRNGPGRPTPASQARTGLGVRGMSERVRALGGRFEAAPRPDGGWVVSARLPVRPRLETGSTTTVPDVSVS